MPKCSANKSSTNDESVFALCFLFASLFTELNELLLGAARQSKLKLPKS